MRVDLNSDLGEASTTKEARREAHLMRFITSANIACGFHAGDPMVIDRTIRLAKKYGVSVGAHPSYPDRGSFGRKSMRLSSAEIELCIVYQLGALDGIARRHRVKMTHVKPHGALYSDAVRNMRIARALARAVSRFNDDLILVGLAGSGILKAGEEEGLKVAAEAFADRAYNSDGTLRSRELEAALIEDPQYAAEQALRIVRERNVKSYEGVQVSVEATTLCIHGDTPNSPAIARAVRQRLNRAGVKISPLVSFV